MRDQPLKFDESEVINTLPKFDFKFNINKLWGFMGPGFLISVAYIDPGNLDIDIQAGARFSYQLIWLMLITMLFGLFVQYLSLKLGIITGLGLADICHMQYNSKICFTLWVLAEVTVICSDIAQVVGSAFALKILFGFKLHTGVLISSISVVILFASDYFGVRKIEFMIAVFMLVILLSILLQLFMANVSLFGILSGFLPILPKDSIILSIAFIGSGVMPHNFYLHSSLVNTREIKKSEKQINEAISYNTIEFLIATAICFLINLAFIALTAAEFFPNKNVSLSNAPILLKPILGQLSPVLLSMAILASCQSSVITSTMAGQYIMQGFLELKIPKICRAAITRLTAILPSFIIVLFVGEEKADNLIIFTQGLLSVMLPFSLIPLVKFSSTQKIMGSFTNSKFTKIFAIFVGLLISSTNIFAVCQLLHQKIENYHILAKIFSFLFVTILSLFYLLFILFLILKPINDEKFNKLDYLNTVILDFNQFIFISEKDSDISLNGEESFIDEK